MTEFHDGEVLDKNGKYSIIHCKVCNFKHLSPFPTAKELEDFYCDQYYQLHKPNYILDDFKDRAYLK